MRFIEFVSKLDAEMWANGKPHKSNWDKTSVPRDPRDYRPVSKDKLSKPNSAQSLRNIGPGAAGEELRRKE